VTIVRRTPPRLVALGIAAALVVAACGAATPTGQPSPAASGVASGYVPAPTSTPWPGNVPNAVIGLGEVDSQIEAAGTAMDAAIRAKDIAGLAAAANGLVALIDESMDLVATAQGYEGTKELGDAYAAAFTQMRAGASDVVEGTQAGDAARIDAGVTALGAGIAAYAIARRGLGGLVQEALSQKRKYVK
jgi:hypothetical protein